MTVWIELVHPMTTIAKGPSMIRSRLLSLVGGLLLLIQVAPILAQERPNILWIMSEDNSKHYLKMFDSTGAITPNIESMAAEGVSFDRAFSNAPVCSVARTTLITMVYAPRIGTQFHRRIEPANLPDGWKMFPQLLREQGYYTTNRSKKDYNAVEPAGVWDESSPRAHWRNRPDGAPFFHVQTFTDSHESSLHFDQDWKQQPKPQTDLQDIHVAPYHPDTPLFRWMNARYHDRIQKIDQKVGALISQLSKAGELENTFVFYFGDHGGVLPRSKGFLYETGLHVPLVVRIPKKWQDLSPFKQGSRTKGFVEFVDFGPTVLNLAGVQVPEYVDGQPFLGANVDAAQVNAENTTLGYADRMDEKYDFCRSLRRGNWKYIRNFQAIYPDGLQNNYRYLNAAWQQWRELGKSGKLNRDQATFFRPKPAEQLFDLSQDPHEVNNLADDPSHRKHLLVMRTTLAARLRAMPDLGFIPESELVANGLAQPAEYGQRNQASIKRYLEIADLALDPFSASEERLADALVASDPIERYWGYSVCSIFGDQASPLFDQAKIAVANDPDLLVRLKAAEFLGIAAGIDPVPAITQIVGASESAIINLMALQSLVHFQDGTFDYATPFDSTAVRVTDDQVIRRLGYLDGLTEAEIRAQMRASKRKTRPKKQ